MGVRENNDRGLQAIRHPMVSYRFYYMPEPGMDEISNVQQASNMIYTCFSNISESQGQPAESPPSRDSSASSSPAHTNAAALL